MRTVYVALAFFLTATALALVVVSQSGRVDAHFAAETNTEAHTDVLCASSVAFETNYIIQTKPSDKEGYHIASLGNLGDDTNVNPSNKNCPAGKSQRCRWIYIGGSNGSQWKKVCWCQ